jgi:hypothetical protein
MLLFLATVLLTLCLLFRILGRRALFILPWLGLTAWLAHSGAFSNFQRLPPQLLLFVLAAVVTATSLAGRVDSSLQWLIGFQLFRIPVEIFLHQGHLAGFVPVQMTWEGRNLDILTGFTAIPVAWLVSRNRLATWTIHVWNAAGFALLVNIMTVAILSFPTPFRQFHNEPANVFVSMFPYVWLPAFLVPAAWFGHVAVFLRARKGL